MSASAVPPTSSGPEPAIRVVSHSGLLFWWPVWLVGFILSALTYLDGGRLAIVPEGTKVTAVSPQAYELTVPEGRAPSLGQETFSVRMSGNRNYGMVYVVVLLLVVVGSNDPLRGLWSVVVIMSLLALTLLLAYFDLWGRILEDLWALHIEISLAGYLVPSVVLLVLWLGTVFGIDQLRFIRFKDGQFVVHQEIGDGLDIYDAARVTLRKRRTDLFRHWVLGPGTGDLIIGLPEQGREIVLPNVLFVDRKVRQMAERMQDRPIVEE